MEEVINIKKAMKYVELKAALEHDEDAEVDIGAYGNYNLIKNSLESFKIQADY